MRAFEEYFWARQVRSQTFVQMRKFKCFSGDVRHFIDRRTQSTCLDCCTLSSICANRDMTFFGRCVSPQRALKSVSYSANFLVKAYVCQSLRQSIGAGFATQSIVQVSNALLCWVLAPPSLVARFAPQPVVAAFSHHSRLLPCSPDIVTTTSRGLARFFGDGQGSLKGGIVSPARWCSGLCTPTLVNHWPDGGANAVREKSKLHPQIYLRNASDGLRSLLKFPVSRGWCPKRCRQPRKPLLTQAELNATVKRHHVDSLRVQTSAQRCTMNTSLPGR